jgi:hypothetical protein
MPKILSSSEETSSKIREPRVSSLLLADTIRITTQVSQSSMSLLIQPWMTASSRKCSIDITLMMVNLVTLPGHMFSPGVMLGSHLKRSSRNGTT